MQRQNSIVNESTGLRVKLSSNQGDLSENDFLCLRLLTGKMGRNGLNILRDGLTLVGVLRLWT